MQKHKLNICLILPAQDYFDQKMPARSAVTEIYGKYIPNLRHNVVWIAPYAQKNKLFEEEKYNNVIVHMISYPHVSSLIQKIFCFTRYYIGIAIKLVNLAESQNLDIVQVRNDVFSSLIVIIFKKKYKYVFAFQYSFPKTLYKSQKFDNYYSYFFNRLQYHIQRYVLNKADIIFPISKWMKYKLVEEGIKPSKMMSLPMGINPELFLVEKNGMRVRERHKINDPIILYVGALDKFRSLDIVIYMHSEVMLTNPKVKLLIVGDGNDKSNLEKLATDLKIDKNVIFTGKISYFEVPEYIAAADICLSPIPPIDMYKVSSPTKMFEYMAMAKPVVCNEEIPEQEEIIKQSKGGILVKFEPKYFAEAVIELLENPSKAKEIGKLGHEWVIMNRSYKKMAYDVENKYFEEIQDKSILKKQY